MRAGVAQYAASGPHTAAITGAATANAAVTAARVIVRLRCDRTRPSTSSIVGGHTQ